MKKSVGLRGAMMIGVIAVSVGGAVALQDVLPRLGITSEAAQDHFWYSLSGGYLSYPDARVLKKIPPAERAEIVSMIGSLAKAYTKSDDFAERYSQWREGRKPEPPEEPQTMDAQRLEQKAQLEASLKESEESLKTMPADLQEQMKPVLEMLRQQIKELDSADNPMFNDEMAGYQKAAFDEQVRSYQKELKEWELENPPDPNQLVKRRLKEFLEETNGIDFAAELKPGREGKMVFVNPTLEQKPSQWKMAFRAGRETVDAARAFAQQWLQELN